MEKLPFIILTYIIIINIISSIICIYDKRQSRCGGWRISEATLFILSLLGGAVAMLFTMKTIHHKTRHKRFMVGLPFIIVLQIITLIFFTLVLDKNII